MEQIQTALCGVRTVLAVLRSPAGRQLSSNTRYKLLLGARPVFGAVPEALNWMAALPTCSPYPVQGLDVALFVDDSIGHTGWPLLELGANAMVCLAGRQCWSEAALPAAVAPEQQQATAVQQQQQQLMARAILCPAAIQGFVAAMQRFLLSPYTRGAHGYEGGGVGG